MVYSLNTEAPVLDLVLSITNDIVLSKVYHKHDDLIFPISSRGGHLCGIF